MFFSWRKWFRHLSFLKVSAAQARLSHEKQIRRAWISLETLEDRVTPTVYTVSALNDSGAGSLRQAISSSNSAGGANEIVFSGIGSSGTITLSSGALPAITDDLLIIGPGADLLTVSGNETYQIFTVGGPGVASISGLTVAQGNAGSNSGGGINNAGSLTVEDCLLTADVATNGGAIENTGILSISGSTFVNNSATANGGAIDNGSAGVFTIANSTFSGNTALTGGGISVDTGAGSPLVLSNSTFSGNFATNGGGLSNAAGLSILGCTLSGNSATSHGGGLYNSSTVHMSDCTVANNSLVISTASASGGAGIYSGNGGTLSINSGTITFNAITYAGAGNNGVGAGIDIASGMAGVLNTMVIANTLGSTSVPSDVAGTLISSLSYYDLFGTGGSGGLANGTNSNQVGVSVDNDGLMNLGSYGGPTQTVGVTPSTVYNPGSPARARGINDFATTSSSIPANQTTSTFTVVIPFYLTTGMVILIGSEQMTITSVLGSTITVSRSGSGPSHNSGTTIGVPYDQRGMSREDGPVTDVIDTDVGAYEFTGFSPSIIQSAYGISSLPNYSNYASGDNGLGQTIALIDMYDDPDIESDLATFDEEFGLPAPPRFEKVGETGGAPPTATDPSGGWEGEETVDVEWAHAIAPMANILIVECADNLVEGADWAATPSNVLDTQTGTDGGGATVVSMSWAFIGGYDDESAYDSEWSAQNYPGVTFLDCTLDDGALNALASATVVNAGSGYSVNEDLGISGGTVDPYSLAAYLTVTSVNGSGGITGVSINCGGGYLQNPTNPASVSLTSGETGGSGATFDLVFGNQVSYPADSPDVVSVGGTTLSVSASGGNAGEGVWNDDNDDGENATEGGISNFESAPSYQQGLVIHDGSNVISANGMRAAPDVVFSGDPVSGFAVYKSYGGSSTDPAANWIEIGGTSISTPSWAGLVAIADQIREENVGSTLSGETQTLPILYSFYDNNTNPSYGDYFNDITNGNNYVGGSSEFYAGPGYDIVTGLGSPIANNLVPGLANALVYDAPSGTNTLVLEASGSNVVLLDNGTQVASYPLDATTSVVIDGGTNNSLTINYDNHGTSLPADLAVSYQGGSSTGSLTLENSTFSNETYNFASGSSGSISLGTDTVMFSTVSSITDDMTSTHTVTLENGNFTNETYSYSSAGSGTIQLDAMTLTYSAVSSIADANTVASLAFDLPVSSVATLENAGPTNDGISEITGSNLTSTTFENPITSLAIATAGGNSQVALDGMDGTFDPTSGISLSGASGDTFDLYDQAALNTWLSLDISTATLVFDSLGPVSYAGDIGNGSGGPGSIAQEGAGTLTITGSNSYSGTTTIAAGSTIEVGNGGSFGSSSNIIDNGVLVWDQTNNSTPNNSISGSGSLTQAGTGTLFLSSSDSYTGGTTINSGSTLEVGTGGTTGSIVGNVVDNGTLSVDLLNTLSLPGIISGIGELIQAGSGTLILTSTNTYTGITLVSSGVLEAGTINAFGNLSSVSMTGGSELDLNGYNQTLGSLAGAGTVEDANANSSTLTSGGNNGTTTFNGSLQNGVGGGTLNVVKNGTGTFILAGSNSYSGTTTINSGGVLEAGEANAFGTLSDITVNSGGDLSLNGFSQTLGSLAGTGIVLDASTTSATLTVGGDNSSTTFTGVLQDGTSGGILSLIKIGTGTFALPGKSSSYSGFTQINSGILSVADLANGGVDSSIGASTNATANLVLAGGTLQYSGGNVTINRNFTLSSASIIGVTTTGVILSIGGVETGAFGFTTTGPGTLAFTTAGALNNVSGIAVTSGSLQATSETLSSNLQLVIASNATFISTGTLVLTPTSSAATVISGAGTLQLNSASSSTNSPDISYGTAIGTNQPVTIAAVVNLGSSTRFIETFSNENLFSNTGGDLIISGPIIGTATSGLTLFGVNNGTALPVTVLDGANQEFLGSVTLESGELVLNNNASLASANSLTMNPISGASSVVYLNDNAMSIGSLSSAGAVGTVEIRNGSNTAGSLTITQSANSTFAGAISDGPNDAGTTTTGALSLNMTSGNNSTLTLTGINTYSGATTVNAGTLLVDGSINPNGAMTVASSATLGGNLGTVGSATVDGNLTPGGPAQLTTSALNFSAQGSFNVALNGTAAGSGYDQVIVNSAAGVNLNSNPTLNLTLGFSPAPGTQFTILENQSGGPVTGTFNGLPEGATLTIDGQVFVISYVGGNGHDIVLTAGSAPSIASQPSNQTVNSGNNATFMAAGSGIPSPAIQWEVNSNNGNGFSPLSNGGLYSRVTSGTLSITGVTISMNGYQYEAVFSNILGTVTSNLAVLTVDFAPTVTNEPSNTTINAGNNASFTAAASGNPTPTVQWQVSTDGGAIFTNVNDGSIYGGATTDTLNISDAPAWMTGYQYQAVFSNTVSPVATSSVSTLTVDFAPTVAGNPAPVAINAGSATTFTASGSGNPAPSVQWYVNTGSGGFAALNDGGVYSGTSTGILTITGATAAMNGYEYLAVFSNGIAPVATTSPATLTVDFAPTLTGNPTNAVVNAGSAMGFSASAGGDPTPSVQWQVSIDGGNTFTDVSNGSVYSGVDTDLLSIAAPTTSMNGYLYQAVFSNTLDGAGSASTATSTAALLTVDPLGDPATSIVSLSSSTVQSGGTIKVTLQAKDFEGNDDTNGGLAVGFGLSNSNSGGQGTFSPTTDNGNGTYSAIFTGTYAGSNTITATIAGYAVTTTLPTLTVTPGPIDLSHSQLNVLLSNVQLGGETTIVLQAEDTWGDKETSGGQTNIAFELENSAGGRGTISSVTDNGNGTYTATFIGTVDGSNTIEATIGGSPVTSTAAIGITGAAVSLAYSTISVQPLLVPAVVQSGTAILVTLQAEYGKNEKEYSGGLNVAFALASGSGGQGTFGPVSYIGNGEYVAAFTGTIAGDNAITATIDRLKVTSKAAPIKVTAGQLSYANSLVTVSAPSVKAGSKITVTFQPRDAAGNNLANQKGLPVSFTLGADSTAQGTFTNAIYNKIAGMYTATFAGTIVGGSTIVTAVNNTIITSTPPVITVTPGTASAANSTLAVLGGVTQVVSGSGITLTLQAVDANGNLETAGGLAVAFKLANVKGGLGTFSKAIDNKNGTYTVTFSGTVAGINTIEATIAGVKITSTATVTVTPGSYSLAKSVVTVAKPGSVAPGITITVFLQTKDAAGNNLATDLLGSETISFAMANSTGGKGTFSPATYMGNGEYEATFTATSAGSNTVVALIGNSKVTSKAAAIIVT